MHLDDQIRLSKTNLCQIVQVLLNFNFFKGRITTHYVVSETY